MLEWAVASSIGGRKEQQDRAGCHIDPGAGRAVLFVADGMGGHMDGARASQAVLEHVERFWRAPDLSALSGSDFLDRVLHEAHEAINRDGGLDDRGPRTTVAILHLAGGLATWAHVGDTRLYLFRDGAQAARTRDDSVVQMLVELGYVREEDQGTHPDQGRLTKSIGGPDDPDPTVAQSPVLPGDGFALCSDGVWEMLRTDELVAGLASDDLEAACQRLVETAVGRAGPGGDNASLVLARLPRP